MNDLLIKKRMDNVIAFIGLVLGLLLIQVNKEIPEFDYSTLYPFLATVAGAYGKMYKDWKVKTFKELAFSASANISLGMIVGGAIFEYYTPVGQWTGLGCFSVGAIIALFVVDALVFVSSRLTDNSWKIFKKFTNLSDIEISEQLKKISDERKDLGKTNS